MHAVIAIGGSAGALEALSRILRDLPSRLDAAVLVVIHGPAAGTNNLPVVLARSAPFSASAAQDGEPLRPRHLLVAPPDLHLLVRDGVVHLSRGPKENRFRPAIDPLFRTVADAYGSGAVGVLLSGSLDDGTAGLQHLKARGGTAVVQHPDDALVPEMPSSAMRAVAVDYILPASEIGGLLARLGAERAGADVRSSSRPEAGTMTERGRNSIEKMPGPPSRLTCPDCGGALWHLAEGEAATFRCHVGHAFSPESLAAAQRVEIENALWGAIRVLEEGSALRRRMAEDAHARGVSTIAAGFEEDAERLHAQADALRRLVTDNG